MMLSRMGSGPGLAVADMPGTGAADVDWNQMLRDITSMQDQLVRPMLLPRFHGRQEAQKALEEKWEKFQNEVGSSKLGRTKAFFMRYGGRITRKARTNLITHILLALSLSRLGELQVNEDQVKMSYEIEMLAVALACFHAEQGRWPAELKELCPSLLKAIPPDRFSEKPLIYRPGEKGYLLYSVGRNLRDDGGQRETSSSGKSYADRKDDIAAEVPAKPS
jgi:hypothetical protein